MCESTVWLHYPDGRTEKIGDDILIIRQEGATVILRGLLAEPRRVTGTIQEIDSLKHIVTLVAPEVPDFNSQASPKEIREAVETLPKAVSGPPDLSFDI